MNASARPCTSVSAVTPPRLIRRTEVDVDHAVQVARHNLRHLVRFVCVSSATAAIVDGAVVRSPRTEGVVHNDGPVRDNKTLMSTTDKPHPQSRGRPRYQHAGLTRPHMGPKGTGEHTARVIESLLTELDETPPAAAAATPAASTAVAAAAAEKAAGNLSHGPTL